MVIKWATILAAVATRIERLKYSSRTNPDEAALTVLTSLEIEVLQADQRDRLPKGTRRKKPPPRRYLCSLPRIGSITRSSGTFF